LHFAALADRVLTQMNNTHNNRQEGVLIAFYNVGIHKNIDRHFQAWFHGFAFGKPDK